MCLYLLGLVLLLLWRSQVSTALWGHLPSCNLLACSRCWTGLSQLLAWANAKVIAENNPASSSAHSCQLSLVGLAFRSVEIMLLCWKVMEQEAASWLFSGYAITALPHELHTTTATIQPNVPADWPVVCLSFDLSASLLQEPRDLSFILLQARGKLSPEAGIAKTQVQQDWGGDADMPFGQLTPGEIQQ